MWDGAECLTNHSSSSYSFPKHPFQAPLMEAQMPSVPEFQGTATEEEAAARFTSGWKSAIRRCESGGERCMRDRGRTRGGILRPGSEARQKPVKGEHPPYHYTPPYVFSPQHQFSSANLFHFFILRVSGVQVTPAWFCGGTLPPSQNIFCS